jgi:hypothetical protein
MQKRPGAEADVGGMRSPQWHSQRVRRLRRPPFRMWMQGELLEDHVVLIRSPTQNSAAAGPWVGDGGQKSIEFQIANLDGTNRDIGWVKKFFLKIQNFIDRPKVRFTFVSTAKDETSQKQERVTMADNTKREKIQNHIETDEERERGHADTRSRDFQREKPDPHLGRDRGTDVPG